MSEPRRRTVQLHLRVAPAVAERLRELAGEAGAGLAEAVTVVLEAAEDLADESGLSLVERIKRHAEHD